MKDLTVRTASESEFAVAINWAKAEGWNPGLDDLSAFYTADPHGFLMGFIDGAPVSSISVVRYGEDFGFLGFYIVHPDYRGKGVGLATWNAGMAYLDGRTVGLDGVVEQQDNYRQSGFHDAGRNVRFSGPCESIQSRDIGDMEIEPVGKTHLEAIADFDRSFFPADRKAFLKAWTLPQTLTRRSSFIAVNSRRIVGLMTIRECVKGLKVGPLFADESNIAMALLKQSTKGLHSDTPIILDVPEQNHSAVSLAQSLGFDPVFETARMYRGKEPKISLSRTFGITTFELG